MGKLCAVISCLLLSVGAATAQAAQTQSERLLPQWLTGIIAVAGFLFLTFVGFLVKKAWCVQPSRSRSKDDMNVYDNPMNVCDDPMNVCDDPMNVYDDPMNVYDDPMNVYDDIEDKVTTM